MDIRQATTDDVAAIREVARRSLDDSYGFVDDELLEEAVDRWYNPDTLTESIAEAKELLLVVETDDGVVGFSQSSTFGEAESVGEIRWLHVDPDHREGGIGRELLDRTCETLRNRGVERIRGLVLADNEAGAEFYEENGFERGDHRTVDVAGDQYHELVYEMGEGDGVTPADSVERREVDGETSYVFWDEGERGSEGTFHPVYRDRDHETLYTWLCGVCGSTDNAMDSMGRLECNECGNVLKPTRWDAAYL